MSRTQKPTPRLHGAKIMMEYGPYTLGELPEVFAKFSDDQMARCWLALLVDALTEDDRISDAGGLIGDITRALGEVKQRVNVNRVNL